MYIDIHILLSRANRKNDENGEKKINTKLKELKNRRRSNLSLKTNMSVLRVWSYFVDSVLCGS